MLKGSSVIRQKGASNSRKNEHFLPQICTRTCAYQKVRNVHFSKKLACFVVFGTPVLRFALFSYYQRAVGYSHINKEDLVVKELSCTIHILDTNIASANFNYFLTKHR